MLITRTPTSCWGKSAGSEFWRCSWKLANLALLVHMAAGPVSALEMETVKASGCLQVVFKVGSWDRVLGETQTAWRCFVHNTGCGGTRAQAIIASTIDSSTYWTAVALFCTRTTVVLCCLNLEGQTGVTLSATPRPAHEGGYRMLPSLTICFYLAYSSYDYGNFLMMRAPTQYMRRNHDKVLDYTFMLASFHIIIVESTCINARMIVLTCNQGVSFDMRLLLFASVCAND